MFNGENGAAGSGPNGLAEFSAHADRPRAEQSGFTPRQVAELIRRYRDAS